MPIIVYTSCVALQMTYFQRLTNVICFWSIYWYHVFSHIRRKIAGNTGQGRLFWKDTVFLQRRCVCMCVCVYWNHNRKGAPHDKEKILGQKGSGRDCPMASSSLFALLVYNFSSCLPLLFYSLLQKVWLSIQMLCCHSLIFFW